MSDIREVWKYWVDQKLQTFSRPAFKILKGHYFVMSGPIDMSVGVFWGTSVGFLKSVFLQLFLKYSQSNVNMNVKSRAKLNCL